MTKLSETQSGQDWLGQFDGIDRQVAADLIDEVLLVSRDDFIEGLSDLLNQFAAERRNPAHRMALYAERPIKIVFGRLPSFFPNSRHGRAMGPGVPPIIVDPRDQEVGSEGIVAQLITDYCRANSSMALNHPGPTKLRSERVRDIVIVSDFIGSGQRIYKMLESFRHVATIRSWRSYGLIRFAIVAYSGTASGIQVIRSHKLKPSVLLGLGCPTIANTFRGTQRDLVETLCLEKPKGHKDPLGYEDTGALIAFAHGCPNNVPPILHSRKSSWRPLFVGRSAASASEAFSDDDAARSVDQRVQNLLGIREVRQSLMSFEQSRWISSMLILAAAEAGLHSTAAISSRTHLKLADVSEIVRLAKAARWLTETGKVTRLGRRELARLRKLRKRKPILPTESNTFYYPTQLRAP